MEFELRQLSISNGIDEYNMLQAIDKEEYGFTNEVNGMSYNEYTNWLIRENNFSQSKNLPENWIPQTTYFFHADGRLVGIARIRHHSSDYLEKKGVGNFGYGIAKPYRGNGYGNILFQEVVKKCKNFGYCKIRSFICIENIASNKIFIKNGAKFVGVLNDTKNIYETSI